MSLPALPEPSAVEVSALTDVCRAVYEQRDTLIGGVDIPTGIEMRRRAAAIEQYLAGTEGYPHAQRAARVLEAAVGRALGNAKRGRPIRPAGRILSDNEHQDEHLRAEFRVIDAGWDKIEPYLDDEVDAETGETSPRGLSREAALRIAKGAHVSANSGEDDWYTPAEYIEAARRVMGGIDLDPASTADANEVIGAPTFYSVGDDGLARRWFGRVWLNPPYAQPLIDRFSEKVSAEYGARNIEQAIVLVNNATETVWFQRMAVMARAVCFPLGRVKFWHPERASSTPLQGQAVIYLGPDEVEAGHRFEAEFGEFGFARDLL